MRKAGIRIAVTALTLTACPFAHAADLEAPTYYAEDRGALGSVKRVVPPDYPQAALKAGLSGWVVVTGVLLPDGSMDARSYEPDRPEADVFADALRQVLPYWQFQVPVGSDCMPTRDPVSVRVDFEVRDGKPHIYVTHDAAKAAAPGQKPSVLKATHEEKLVYPYSMIRLGAEAVVFARSDVDPEGHVTHVVAETYARRHKLDLDPFAREAEDKLAQWRYPAAPGVPLRHVCYDIWFKFRD